MFNFINSGTFWFFLTVGSLVNGILACYVASEKGYSSGIWFFIGFFLGIFGLIASAGLPSRKTNSIPEKTSDSLKDRALVVALIIVLIVVAIGGIRKYSEAKNKAKADAVVEKWKDISELSGKLFSGELPKSMEPIATQAIINFIDQQYKKRSQYGTKVEHSTEPLP